MNKQQLQSDISESSSAEVKNQPTQDEIDAANKAWDETLNSEESGAFLDGLIAKGLAELDAEDKADSE